MALRVLWLQMVGTLSLGPYSEVRDVWQNLEDIGYCFELKTVADSGEVKTNVFMVSWLLLMTKLTRLAGFLLILIQVADCSELSSARHYMNQEVQPRHSSSAWSSLAFSPAAYQFQAGYDGLQVPAWSGTVLPGWRLHCRVVRRRQVAAAVGE